MASIVQKADLLFYIRKGWSKAEYLLAQMLICQNADELSKVFFSVFYIVKQKKHSTILCFMEILQEIIE